MNKRHQNRSVNFLTTGAHTTSVSFTIAALWEDLHIFFFRTSNVILEQEVAGSNRGWTQYVRRSNED